MPVNIGELVATTHSSIQKKLTDNFSRNTELMKTLTAKGKVEYRSGRKIRENLEFTESGTAMYYSGGEQLNATPVELIDAAEFNWKQASAGLTFTGLETDIQNEGDEQIIELVSSKMSIAERELKLLLGGTNGVYSDGTYQGGKSIGGLPLLIADTPTSGSVGGIDRASYTFWRNQSFDCTTDGGAAATSANIVGYMNRMYVNTMRGDDKVDLIVADNNYYLSYLGALQPLQQIGNANKADAGYPDLAFMKARVVCDGGYGGGIATNHMYFINTSYIKMVMAKKRNFSMIQNDGYKQDAFAKLILWAGNLVASNLQLQGVIKD